MEENDGGRGTPGTRRVTYNDKSRGYGALTRIRLRGVHVNLNREEERFTPSRLCENSTRCGRKYIYEYMPMYVSERAHSVFIPPRYIHGRASLSRLLSKTPPSLAKLISFADRKFDGVSGRRRRCWCWLLCATFAEVCAAIHAAGGVLHGTLRRMALSPPQGFSHGSQIIGERVLMHEPKVLEHRGEILSRRKSLLQSAVIDINAIAVTR